jgi:hypothetical protein
VYRATTSIRAIGLVRRLVARPSVHIHRFGGVAGEAYDGIPATRPTAVAISIAPPRVETPNLP